VIRKCPNCATAFMHFNSLSLAVSLPQRAEGMRGLAGTGVAATAGLLSKPSNLVCGNFMAV